ncbi:AraC family transcriptional regulator [Paenibacillus cremeus]|uniref:AraC family transcriptional regulator n=1 Tax=Paenibacillus cremeus TaxID=2163881 RepID=A0A559KC14_9BACL|nr:AraC family transcriptional regulator [Paenibacillus cremeus]TVY09678.1 AraC family transcriptional regulator [Paenibacillus cremeus]
MTANLLTCGYSYHKERFYNQFKSGLLTYLFRLQTEGSSVAVINGQTLQLGVGDLLLLSPGDKYELTVEEREVTAKGNVIASGDYYIFCEGSWIDEWWKRNGKRSMVRIDPDERLLALWRQLVLEQRRRQQENNEELIGYLLRSLCLMLDRAAQEISPATGPSFTAARLKRFIEEHATLTFKVEDAAKQAGLSVSRAVHLFKACYGKTMMEYALDIRLSTALERMKYTAMTLEQIAESCGFGSYSYFHRVFKERYGVSPGSYRSDS